MNIPPLAGIPGDFIAKGIRETAPVFEEPVVLFRFTSATGGNAAAGIAPTKSFSQIPTTASIEELTAQEIAASNGIYEAGDLRASFSFEIFGAETGQSSGNQQSGDWQTAGRYSDVVTYRGRGYRVVGHPERIFEDGCLYWRALLRQERS